MAARRPRPSRPVARVCLIPFIAALAGCATLGSAQPELDPTAERQRTIEESLAEASRAMQHGQQSKAIYEYAAVLNQDPQNNTALLALGTLQLRNGNYRIAEAAFAKALEYYPDSPVALEGRGTARLRLQRHENSATDFKRAVALDPDRWKSWNSLGILADLDGDHEAALGYYDRALAILPDAPLLLNNKGYSLLMAHRYGEAEAVLRSGLAIDPEDAGLRNNLGMALAWQRRYPEAVRVIGGRLSEPTAYNNVGYVAMLQGDLKLARSYFKKALETDPRYYVRAAKNLDRVEAMLASQVPAAAVPEAEGSDWEPPE